MKFFEPFQHTLMREMKRMMSRPIYFLGSVGIMTFSFIFFLTLINNGLPTSLPVGIVDLDHSSVSRQFIRNLNATQLSEVKMKLGSFTEAREEMQKGNIYGCVLIDKGFENDLISHRRPKLTFYINDAYLIAGSLLLKDITYMSELSSASFKMKVLQAQGENETNIIPMIRPINLETHLLGNPWTNYGVYLLNVILPGILQLVILLMTVFPIGIELKEKTAPEWLATSNHNLITALTGKLLPYTVLLTMLGFLSNVLLYRYMDFPLNTNIGWMFLASFLFVLAYQAIGIFIIGATPKLSFAISVAAFYGVLGISFAGLTFPIEQMMPSVQIFSILYPIRHYFKIYVNQALLGAPPIYSYVSFLILLTFNVLPLFVYVKLKRVSSMKFNDEKNRQVKN